MAKSHHDHTVASSDDGVVAGPNGPLGTQPSTAAVSTRVDAKAPRTHRIRSAAEKLRLVLAFKACSTGAERGALARTEGLYLDQLQDWTKVYDQGGEKALERRAHRGKPSQGSKSATRSQGAPAVDVVALQRELASYKARALQAEALVEVQKKVLHLLELLKPENNDTR